MKHATLCLIALFVLSSPVFSQATPQGPLPTAFAYEQKGQFNQVIATIQPLIDTHQLTGIELAKASIMIGVAYEASGDLNGAQAAYGRALQLLEHDAEHLSEYGAALQNYGGLYSNTGQLDLAEAMWAKALEIRRQTGDHAATMRSLSDLAGLALARNNPRLAHEYLKKASNEMKLAHDLVNDDFVVLSETQGWLALTEGHPATAVFEYGRALELCTRIHGEQHWLTGWEHMLLGKSYAQSGDVARSLAEMEKGLSIFERTLGHNNPKYFAAQIAYSQVLDLAGSHAKAVSLRSSAEAASKEFFGSQCAGCAINKAAFRQ